MTLLNLLTDVKAWVIIGIILGITVGFDSPDSATILMVVLIVQMTLSLDGLSFGREDFRRDAKGIAINVACCFLVNTGLTLITGLFFIDDTALWYGWVMLSAVPCGVSVVSAALLMKGDTKLAVLSLTAIYILALGLTPLITHTLIGSAVSPLEVLRYILMFILIPFILTIPLKRLHLPRVPKVIGINIMMMLMISIGLGSRRDYIFTEPMVVVWIVIACLFRIFAFSTVLTIALKRMGAERGAAITHISMAFWKNSGMAASMTMALLATVYPSAVLPCIVSLVMEASWFAIFNALVRRIWPAEGSAY